ncbi:putative transmembrane protein [Toxoplasma gondii RUB]|uniref:Putative transmembrane protein n=1 Tax=Toxoplasma gondii RUB TaxID=935652 RepID=A0A086LNJ3_TOXGO|nr:putative transmembrane protein [Toxoplasma gondii RUB]
MTHPPSVSASPCHSPAHPQAAADPLFVASPAPPSRSELFECSSPPSRCSSHCLHPHAQRSVAVFGVRRAADSLPQGNRGPDARAWSRPAPPPRSFSPPENFAEEEAAMCRQQGDAAFREESRRSALSSSVPTRRGPTAAPSPTRANAACSEAAVGRPQRSACPPIGCKCVPVPKELSAYLSPSKKSSLLSVCFDPRLFFRGWPAALAGASKQTSCLPVSPSIRFSLASSVLPNLLPLLLFALLPFLSLLALQCLLPSCRLFVLVLGALPILPLLGLGVVASVFFVLSWLALKLASPP